MTKIDNTNSNSLFRNACIVIIWFIAAYASIIQYLLFEIPNAMLMLGVVLLAFYTCAINRESNILETLTDENLRMLYFMAYMFVVGLVFSPKSSVHVSQWITCMEYLFLQIVIAYIIKSSGTNSFHILLLADSAVLAVVFLKNPVEVGVTGRYSISTAVNPNGLGMIFTAGIWATLYQQQKSKISLILTGLIISILGFCILLTGSRKSLIGAGITIILWLYFCFFPNLKGRGAMGIASIILLIILVAIIGHQFMISYKGSTLAQRMNNIFYEINEGKRSEMYHEGLELIKETPLFGIGFEGFLYHFGIRPHATIIEVPVSGGIIGTLMYFCAYYISIKKMVYIYAKTKNVQEYSLEHTMIKMVFILFALMCFYATCIIHPYQFNSYIQFGIIFGETAYLDNKLKSKQELPETRRKGSKYIKYV